MATTPFRITGGAALHGQVRCEGAKNAALPIMAAAILASEPVHLQNVPRLTDIATQSKLLRRLGLTVSVEPSDEKPSEMTLETTDARPVFAPEPFVRQMRASFCVLGPLLARRRKAVVPLPGGCRIGDRPVDLHLKGLTALGADLRLEHGCVVAEARRLTGATVDLSGPRGPSVTGTANVLSAAVLARGVTILHGAALEPEIVDLGRFLIALGAKIEGLGTPILRIEGVEQLGGARHRLIPDRIEAATLLLAAAITGGSVTVFDVLPDHMDAVLEKLRATGATVDVAADRVSITATGPVRPVSIAAEPFPGLPTDVQAQWTALMSLADGECTVQDRVFGSRFSHVAELNRLGAHITCRDDTAVIHGVERLEGTSVAASDLRASAALVLAGLAAEGQTTIEQVRHLDRGYQRLDEKLRQLGARIERTESEPSDRDSSPLQIFRKPLAT
ncbi:MAG: UDP-N-acetylglucosamine 1-carboxyvinyltransferase [Thermoguttaceae bacterium]